MPQPKFEPPVTIITSIFSSTDDFLKRLDESVKSQRYSGKIKHIYINDNVKRPRKIAGLNIINNKNNLGLAKTLKKGFEMAKTEIIVSLMDDCLPSSNTWLRTLVAPLKNPEVAATSSKVELPFDFWNKFDFFAKAMTEKEQRVLVPGLDEKGCAYKNSIVRKFGYFDTENFANGGEDTDLTIKLSKKYKILNSGAKVYHYHGAAAKSRIKKEIQYAELTGLVSRKHFFSLHWYVQAHIALKLALPLILIASLFSSTKYLPIAISIAILLLANLRLPFQVRRLWRDSPSLTLTLPFFNLFLYLLYVCYFSYALIFKPHV
ncbi:MAG: glycosyltransferase [archaeon]|nr:glycosyltransferase [archaeon]